MGLLEDILKSLDRIPVWKRLQEIPGAVNALEQRVAALEAQLGAATGETCPKCRQLTYQLLESKPAPPPFERLGAMEDHYRCSACGYTNKVSR